MAGSDLDNHSTPKLLCHNDKPIILIQSPINLDEDSDEKEDQD